MKVKYYDKVQHLAKVHRWWWWSRTLCRAPSSTPLCQGRRRQLGPPGIFQKSCCRFYCYINSRLETSLAVPQASDVWASLNIAWKAPSWPTSLSGEIVQPWGRLGLVTWEEVVTWRSLWQTFYSGAPGQTKAPPTIEFQLTAAPAGKNFFSFSSELKFQLESNSKNNQEQSNWVQNKGLTFAPAASMLFTHSSRFSIIAEQLDVIKEVMNIISMVKYCEN